MPKITCFALTLTFFVTISAHALCIYKGEMYAKTTVAEEFSDSRWVVRAKVVAADQHWSDMAEPWTLYHLQVVESLKGHPPSRIEVFTYRDSGAFYLDKGMNPDLGGEYLLFLDPVAQVADVPNAARPAYEINYNCGQSKEWRKVSPAEQSELRHLSDRN